MRPIYPDISIHFETHYGEELIFYNTRIRKKFGRYYYLIDFMRSYKAFYKKESFIEVTKEIYNCMMLSKLNKVKTIDGRSIFEKDTNQEPETKRLEKKYYKGILT